MNRLGLSFLVVAALASTSAAQSANQQYRPNDRQQTQSQPAKSSQPKGQQSGTLGGVSASASNASSASANAGPASAGLSSGTTVNAELLTTLDARKCHPGQRVVAKTTQDVKQNGHVVLRKGTRLIGHVTQAQARTKENAESSVGIMFDEAVMKKGHPVPFHAAIQALAAARTMSAASLGDDGMMEPSGPPMGSGAGAMGGGALVGGAGSAMGAAAGATGGMAGNLSGAASGTLGATSATAASAGGNLRGLNAAGQLTSTSSGVIGMNGLNLTSAASNSTGGSVITSTNRNVHLSSGTQMLLRANGGK